MISMHAIWKITKALQLSLKTGTVFAQKRARYSSATKNLDPELACDCDGQSQMSAQNSS